MVKKIRDINPGVEKKQQKEITQLLIDLGYVSKQQPSSSVDANTSATPQSQGSMKSADPIQGKKVLFIGDFCEDRSLIASVLSAKKIHLVEAANGTEGIEELANHPDIRLIFLDWNIDEKNSMQFLKLAQPFKVLSSIPVVLVAKQMTRGLITHGQKVGISQFVLKPIKEESFCKALGAVFPK